MIAYSTKTRDGTVRLYHYGRLVALISETTLTTLTVQGKPRKAWAYQGVGWRGADWNGTATSATIAAMKDHQENGSN